MKLKQWLSLLLALALFIGTLCGCGSNDPSLRDDEDDDDRRPSASAPNEETTKPSNPNDSTSPSNPVLPMVDISRITSTYSFSEGLCFIEMDDNHHKTHCINNKGELVFSLDYGFNCEKFYNGIAILTRNSGIDMHKKFFCDTSGTLTSFEELGITTVLAKYSSYMIVEKETVAFNGSTFELGILNYNLEFIVPYSQELHTTYSSKFSNSSKTYYEGYLFDSCTVGGECLNLSNGMIEPITQNLADRYNSYLTSKYPSDYWVLYSNNNYYDSRDDYSNRVPVLELTQYEGNISNLTNFNNGIAGIAFSSNFFGIIDEKGKLLYEPISINSANCNIYRQDNTFYVFSLGDIYKEKTIYIEVLNETGKLASYVHPYSTSSRTIFLSDGIIIIWEHGGDSNISYYTLEMEPLF